MPDAAVEDGAWGGGSGTAEVGGACGIGMPMAHSGGAHRHATSAGAAHGALGLQLLQSWTALHYRTVPLTSKSPVKLTLRSKAFSGI